MKKTLSISRLFMVLGVVSFSAHAATTPELSNLTQTQAEAVMKNFSAALVFRSVEPASSYGSLFGITLGVVASGTSAKDINDALTSQTDISMVPSADLVAGVQLPFGLAVELGGIPKVTVSDLAFSKYGLNAKWTFTDLLLRELVPFDAALRFGTARSHIRYDQVISGNPGQISFNTRTIQAQLAMSRQFAGIIEPYLGLGFIRQLSSLSATGSAPLYNFTTSQSFKHQSNSFWFNAGAELRLTVLTVAAQFDSFFGATSYSAKIGFKF